MSNDTIKRKQEITEDIFNKRPNLTLVRQRNQMVSKKITGG